MRRWWRRILLFVAVYLLALIATLPAAQALYWARPALAHLPQQPQLLGVDGTLWSGRAAQLVYRGVSLGAVTWKLEPWKLLLGRLDARLALNGGDSRLDTRLSWKMGSNQVQISQLEGHLPALLLKEAVPNLPVLPTGDVTMAITAAQLEGTQLRALDGRALWNKGGVSSPMALEFGDLVAEFKTQSGTINGHIHDSGGPLRLDAQLQLTQGGGYTMNGKAASRASAAAALTTSLSLLGQADGQGMIPFHFSGRLQ